jgi:putative protease
MPELLAPAGGMDALRAAVRGGADAVYIGVKSFNARAYADNFDWEDVKRAADYCHLRGVSLYLTLNTMILEGEMEEGAEAARQAYLAGADALIVADLGLADAIISCCKEIPLHASTQMCVHNEEGAALAAGRGFKRVVLAREMSLEDIRGVIREGGTEAEVFVHGALCSSVSGLCLLSSFIGQRSGNRGRCAQPCRLEYAMDKKDAYHLSVADLCAADYILEMVQSGVAAFKIEGRMKSSLYVGGVVRAYRRILDAALEGKRPPADSLENLKGYYNRTFTSDYLTGGTDVTATDRPGNRNLDKERPEGYGEANEEKTLYSVKAAIRLEEGKRPLMEVFSEGVSAMAEGEEILSPAMRPLAKEIVIRSAGKTGGTPFKMDENTVKITGNPYISVSSLNRLRKSAIEALEEEMLKKFRMRDCVPRGDAPPSAHGHELKEVFVQTGLVRTAIQCLLMGAGRVYYAPGTYDKETLARAALIKEETGKKPYIALPPFLRRADMERMEELLEEYHPFFGGALAGNFSQIKMLKAHFENVIADYTCNISNRRAVRAYREMGFTGVSLSAELNKKDINSLKGGLPAEIVAYGYLPLMWLAHPLDAEKMTDRRGYEYAIIKSRVQSEMQTVLNPVLLAMREISSIRHSVDAVRLLLREDTGVLGEYIRAVREGEHAKIEAPGATQGHLKRGV